MQVEIQIPNTFADLFDTDEAITRIQRAAQTLLVDLRRERIAKRITPPTDRLRSAGWKPAMSDE